MKFNFTFKAVTAFAAAVMTFAHGTVIELDTSSFDGVALGSKPALIEFYASWCGFCKKLAPIYEDLGKIYNNPSGDQNKVVIARIDADKEHVIAARYEISGFPTIKMFLNGKVVPYDGDRTVDGMSTFIQQNLSSFKKDN